MGPVNKKNSDQERENLERSERSNHKLEGMKKKY